jgi:hypothetical protein
MTRPQERTLSMFMLVVSFLKKNLTITATVPHFTPNFDAFEALVNEIRDIAQRQSVQTNTATAKYKKDLRASCFSQMQTVVDAVNSYSVGINDDVLLAKVSVGISKYNTIADTAFATGCETFYNIALPLAADLAPYGTGAPYLAAFRADIDTYLDIITDPRESIIERANTTKLLATLFDNGKKEVVRLTKLVSIKRLSEPSFFSKFTESIKIVDTGSTKIALRVSLKDQNGLPLRAFTFTFVRPTDGKAFEYKTNDNGTIVRQFFKEGEYTVTIAKIGYTTFVGNIIIEDNVTYKLEAVANTVDKVVSF